MIGDVYATVRLPPNVRAAIARLRTPVSARNFNHEVSGEPRFKVPWPRRARLPKGIDYLPDDGPPSRAQWGLIKRKAMMSRAKLGRFGKRRSIKFLFPKLVAFDPGRHGGEIDFGPTVGKERD